MAVEEGVPIVCQRVRLCVFCSCSAGLVAATGGRGETVEARQKTNEEKMVNAKCVKSTFCRCSAAQAGRLPAVGSAIAGAAVAMPGAPLSSLVKYETPSLLTTKSKGAKGAKGGKKLPPVEAKQPLTQTEDILNSILPPRYAPERL
jgi:hypothetical protein